VAQGDAGRVEEVAHGLKGSAAQLGATRMASLCAALSALQVSAQRTIRPD